MDASPVTRNTVAPNEPPLPTSATLTENHIHTNSVNNMDATVGSNSSSSSTRVNNRLASFESAVEGQFSTAQETLPPSAAAGASSLTPLVRSAKETCGTYISECAHLVQRYLAYFDGTSAALRFCHGATVPSVPGLKTPEGYQDFTLAWSGIAFAVFRKILTDELPDKKDVCELVSLELSVQDARVLAAESLAVCVGDAIGSRRYSYDNVATYAQSISDSSEEMMRRWVESRPALPSHLATHYTGVEDEVKSADDLDAILMQAMMMWVASFFPYYQSLKRQGGGSDIRFFWQSEPELRTPTPSTLPRIGTQPDSTATTTSTPSPLPAQDDEDEARAVPAALAAVVVPDDDFLFSVYSFCSYENRMVNAEGAPRGCVVPRRWLVQFTQWLTAAVRAGPSPTDGQPSQEAVAAPPGPLNTFQCVELASGSPNRHWLGKGERNGHGVVETVEAYEVVPEGLFDVLALRFGSGPKYMTYAHCTFLAPLMEVTRPQPVQATICFTNAADPGARVVAVVEEALLRTTLSELLRVALYRHKTRPPHAAPAVNEEQAAQDAQDAHPPHDTSDWVQKVLTTEACNLELEVVVPAAATPQAGAQNEEPHDTAHTGDGARRAFLDGPSFLDNGTISAAVQRAYEASNDVLVPSTETLRVTLNIHVLSELGNINPYVPGPGVCGLTNVGNTCYMNSALQALSNVGGFRRAFFSTVVSRFPRATIAQAYMQLMMDLWSGRVEYAETYALKRVIGERVPRFSGYDQQDANELVEVLLDHLGEELNTVSSKSYRERHDSDVAIPTPELAKIFWEDFLLNNKSLVPREFFYQSKTVFTCLSCGERTRVFDNNLTLGLPIKEVPVQRTVRVNVLVDCDISALVHIAATCTAPVTRLASNNGLVSVPVLPPHHVRVPVCASVVVAVQPNDSIVPGDLSVALAETLKNNVSLASRIREYATQLQSTMTAPAADAAPETDAAGSAAAALDEDADPSVTSASTAVASDAVATDVMVDNELIAIDEEQKDVDAAEESPAVALEFDFHYLDEVMTMQRKPVVWARCIARHAATTATPAAAPAAAAQAAAEADSDVPSRPHYRVWYFLHHKTSFNDFQRGALLYPAYVEDLVAPADAPPLSASLSPSATEEEEGDAVTGLSRCGAGPLTQRILTTGQAIGDTVLSFYNTGAQASPASTRGRGGVSFTVSGDRDDHTRVVPSAKQRPARQRRGNRRDPISESTSPSASTSSDSKRDGSCDSSRDGDDERDAKTSAATPLPNPVDVCTATWRNTQLRTVADLQAQGGDAWLGTEWLHARENQSSPQSKADQTDAKHKTATLTSPTRPASGAAQEAPRPVDILVFVRYEYSDARIVREFSPVNITHPPFMKDKDRTPQCSLDDCLTKTAQEEKLSDDDAWYCPRCKELRETVVKRTLFRLPPCLIMCFKRFKTNSLHAEKNNTLISFPSQLDMSPYLDPEAAHDGASSHYRLRSIVYHTGSLSYGHYTASAFNDSVRKWVYYNDTRASVEGLEDPSPVGAYILCYERIGSA